MHRNESSQDVEFNALCAILSTGSGMVQTVCTFMRAKLACAHEEMETAKDEQQLFRAQGRAQLAREILSQLTRRDGANLSEIL